MTTITITDQLAARAAWSVIAEPGEHLSGVFTQTFGHERALGILLEGDAIEALALAGVTESEAAAALQRWKQRTDERRIAENLEAIERHGLALVDPAEIPGLADLGTTMPHVLYVRGDAASLTRHEHRIAIVGARAATPYGEHVTAQIAEGLSEKGAQIVSGGAYGVDGAAHRATLARGGSTIAFVAGSAARVYPAGHAQLFARIAESGGAIVSETPVDAAPTKWRFLMRNRVIASFSQATIVAEAGARSGSLNTAGHAHALGHPIGAVPGPVTSVTSTGCHRLVREFGATLIAEVDHAAELIGL